MLTPCKNFYGMARGAHQQLYGLMLQMNRLLQQTTELTELADAVFALRKTEELLEDTRKECSKLLELAEQVTCIRWLACSDHEPIRSEYCTASPDVKQTVAIPSKSSPEYAALLKHYGIPEGSPFVPHWPSLLKQVSADLAAGGSIPPGCDPNKMIRVCKVRTLTKKKPILDEGEAVPLISVEALKESYSVHMALSALDSPALLELSKLVAHMQHTEATDIGIAVDEEVQYNAAIAEDKARIEAAREQGVVPAAPEFMDADSGILKAVDPKDDVF